MSIVRVGVTSRSFSQDPILRQELLQIFPHTIFNETGKHFTPSECADFLKNCDRAITALDVINDEFLKKLPQLKVISKYGVGLDSLDFQALEKYQVSLGWTPGVNKRSVAELALCFMLSAIRKVTEAASHVRTGTWKQWKGGQLTEKTVGIVGCGNVGKDLVTLLSPFRCNILVNDIHPDETFNKQHGIKEVSLDQLLSQSDIISLHVPKTPSTENMLSESRLSQIKKGAVLINTARGHIVCEKTLKSLLISGHLAAAAFDVFAEEPPTDQTLLQLPQFLITPHIGGSSNEAILAMGRAAIKGLSEFFPAHQYKKYLYL